MSLDSFSQDFSISHKPCVTLAKEIAALHSKQAKMWSDYYVTVDEAHGPFDGADSGILGTFEVIKSDFTKSITEIVVGEQTDAATYDKQDTIEKSKKDRKSMQITSH